MTIPITPWENIQHGRGKIPFACPCHTWLRLRCYMLQTRYSTTVQVNIPQFPLARNAELTIATTIRESSQPKARITRNRTKHRSSTVASEIPPKTAVTIVISPLWLFVMIQAGTWKQAPACEACRKRGVKWKHNAAPETKRRNEQDLTEGSMGKAYDSCQVWNP